VCQTSYDMRLFPLAYNNISTQPMDCSSMGRYLHKRVRIMGIIILQYMRGSLERREALLP
jgi:hypothetical protein